ncbi:hypothetical protein P7K49_018209 [Saguinus oedipus]|uniref:Alpha-(1,6)-fucosyltransferase N- and catalytic domain-containing protein n=1 Tax=Saguinus oedipus TaxID=9490 RepID=A0ABQ9V4S5_SAGOE|nr:hypothetical protein P7K49_018209 [Saguinus oedipus]
MTDLYYLSQTDGAGDWREKEAKDLTELVQRRITYLQEKVENQVFKDIVKNQTDLGLLSWSHTHMAIHQRCLQNEKHFTSCREEVAKYFHL